MSITRIGVAGLTVVAIVAGLMLATRSDTAQPETATTADTPVLAIETVTRRTLQRTEEFNGALSYGDQFALPGQASGTVSWVPEAGAVLQPGHMLYRADEKPVYWARGDVPMYRTLGSESEGVDVEQLQRYLQEEGYLDAEAEIDGDFGSATRRAVRAWQDDRDLEKTGRIDATQLLFLPYQSIRVAKTPRVGEPARDGVIEVTESDLFATADVSARQKPAFEGQPVIEVETANGSRYAATVESITAQQSQNEYGGQNYRVRLHLGAADDQEPGKVSIEAMDVLVEDALTIPARALVALVEGGYAVEVVQPDGTATYTAVEIGEFADGWVEITGRIAEGDQVVVPG